MRKIALILALAALTACSSSKAPNPSTPSTERPTARALSVRMRCVAYQPDQEPELFVREQGNCAFAEDAVNTYPTIIYVFTDGMARDNWLKAAATFGTGPLVVGPTWVIAVGVNCDPASPCDVEERARTIQAAIGGEVR